MISLLLCARSVTNPVNPSNRQDIDSAEDLKEDRHRGNGEVGNARKQTFLLMFFLHHIIIIIIIISSSSSSMVITIIIIIMRFFIIARAYLARLLRLGGAVRRGSFV